MHEVLAELEAEHPAQADGHVRIAGEIIVNLEGICQSRRPGQAAGDISRRQLVDMVGASSQHVGKKNLLSETDHKAADAGSCLLQGHLSAVDLIADILVLDDRSRDQLREEGYIEGQLQHISLHGALAAIHVNYIRQGLEGKERNSNGYSPIQSL